ncbi:hypothetical protein B0H11DRAFT_1926079 [Mycena galericulata]|nr:hypothetical protein B0H11DRAFT_1926079 [Mycena galericulata]
MLNHAKRHQSMCHAAKGRPGATVLLSIKIDPSGGSVRNVSIKVSTGFYSVTGDRVSPSRSFIQRALTELCLHTADTLVLLVPDPEHPQLFRMPPTFALAHTFLVTHAITLGRRLCVVYQPRTLAACLPARTPSRPTAPRAPPRPILHTCTRPLVPVRIRAEPVRSTAPPTPLPTTWRAFALFRPSLRFPMLLVLFPTARWSSISGTKTQTTRHGIHGNTAAWSSGRRVEGAGGGYGVRSVSPTSCGMPSAVNASYFSARPVRPACHAHLSIPDSNANHSKERQSTFDHVYTKGLSLDSAYTVNPTRFFPSSRYSSTAVSSPDSSGATSPPQTAGMCYVSWNIVIAEFSKAYQNGTRGSEA